MTHIKRKDHFLRPLMIHIKRKDHFLDHFIKKRPLRPLMIHIKRKDHFLRPLMTHIKRKPFSKTINDTY